MSRQTEGGMGAVAPMETQRQRGGWVRRGARPWPVTGSPTRPGRRYLLSDRQQRLPGQHLPKEVRS